MKYAAFQTTEVFKSLIFPALPFYLKALFLHADFKTIYLKYTYKEHLPMCIIIYILLYNVLPSWRRKAALISMQANIHFIDNTKWKILFSLHLYIIPQWFCAPVQKSTEVMLESSLNIKTHGSIFQDDGRM